MVPVGPLFDGFGLFWHQYTLHGERVRPEGCIEGRPSFFHYVLTPSKHSNRNSVEKSQGPQNNTKALTGRRRPPFAGTALVKADGTSLATWMPFPNLSILPIRHLRHLKYPCTMQHHCRRLAGFLPFLAKSKCLTSHGMHAVETVGPQPRSTLIEFGVREGTEVWCVV